MEIKRFHILLSMFAFNFNLHFNLHPYSKAVNLDDDHTGPMSQWRGLAQGHYDLGVMHALGYGDQLPDFALAVKHIFKAGPYTVYCFTLKFKPFVPKPTEVIQLHSLKSRLSQKPFTPDPT